MTAPEQPGDGTPATTVVHAEVRHLALPTGIEPFVLPSGQRTPTDLAALLLRLTDDDGVVGHSLLWAQREQQLALFEAGLRYLAGAVEGRRPDEHSAIMASVRQATAFVGAQGVAAFAASGLEMALQDLACRRRERSLSGLLGRRREHVRAYRTGLMLQSSVDELVAEAHESWALGFRALKMVAGKPSIEEDVERIRAVRSSLPPDATLMVDALQGWSLPDALRAAEALAGLDLKWIEDPIPQGDVAGYRELARRSPVPIATGETCFSPDAFDALLDAGIPYVVGELERVGGIGPWIDLAGVVHERSAVLLPHIYPHVSAQLLAVVPQDEVWWEHVTWFDELAGGFELEDGLVRVGDRPGTGFDPRPDAVERFARGPWVPLTT